MSEEDYPIEYPCPICGELRELGISKKDKPYFCCNTCGVQVFIRGREGISRLIAIKNNPELFGYLKALNAVRNSRLLQIKTRLELLNKEINRYDEDGIYYDSPEKDRVYSEMIDFRDELEKDFQKLLTKKESIADSK